MSQQMLRAVLDRLRANHDLLICPQEVDPRFELGAVLSYYDNERPTVFTKVLGSRVPVAGAIYGNRRIFCELLGTPIG